MTFVDDPADADDRERQALGEILHDFELEQRRLLLNAVDKAIDKAVQKQGLLLEDVKTKVAARHRQALADARDELARAQPSMMDALVAHTLGGGDGNAAQAGLLRWIRHAAKQQQAADCVARLRGHLEARQGNLFRSDFEALLVVYMEYLEIPMTNGSRLGNRIEDFKTALQQTAASTDELSNLVYRVNWACYGVRTIGNARSHDAAPLSDAEMLELCGCFSALGAAMPTLAQEFEAARAPPPPPPPVVVPPTDEFMDVAPAALLGGMDLNQLRQLAGSGNGYSGGTNGDFERLLQLLSVVNGSNGSGHHNAFAAAASSTTLSAPNYTNQAIAAASSASPPGYPPLPAAAAPPLPPGFARGGWGQPEPMAVSTSSQSQVRVGSPQSHASPPPLPPSPGAFAVQQASVPTQAALAAVPSFGFYHVRPTELPKETDRTRMAMFARMINHMGLVPKATLCPFPDGHDSTCRSSHSYLEVMAFNPLFKRLICRQPSHYWGSQVEEDEKCVCIHVDTGLTWEWLDEARDKRMFCPRGAKCTNHKCFKSHSFEEMCWFNPAYKIKKCAVRAHDHIARARGTVAPPLDCNYYHIEMGKYADMRQLMNEDDHVGRPVKMLFVERTHKPLADALEALRYARNHNL